MSIKEVVADLEPEVVEAFPIKNVIDIDKSELQKQEEMTVQFPIQNTIAMDDKQVASDNINAILGQNNQ